eukprot:SAG11_NODE_1993_length_3953_cov_3.205501_5_plen_147_part_00
MEVSEEQKANAQVLAAHGIMDEADSLDIDREHHKWLLPPMTKALLSGQPVLLSNTVERSAEVNSAVRGLFEAAGFSSSSGESELVAAAEADEVKTGTAVENAMESLQEHHSQQLSQRWAENGLGEHASVASFARFTVCSTRFQLLT